jgi:POT family proton-dependent oligopeptide transporter
VEQFQVWAWAWAWACLADLLPRVGNLGSLSWFATVYIELHIGFTAAYGLALGFMAVASVTLVGGSRCYGMCAWAKPVLPQRADVVQ